MGVSEIILAETGNGLYPIHPQNTIAKRFRNMNDIKISLQSSLQYTREKTNYTEHSITPRPKSVSKNCILHDHEIFN